MAVRVVADTNEHVLVIPGPKSQVAPLTKSEPERVTLRLGALCAPVLGLTAESVGGGVGTPAIGQVSCPVAARQSAQEVYVSAPQWITKGSALKMLPEKKRPA